MSVTTTPTDRIAHYGAALLREHFTHGFIKEVQFDRIAVDAGVMEWVTATEPCGTYCKCAEIVTKWPQECLHIPDDVYAASVALLGGAS